MTATSPQLPLPFVPADCLYIDSCLKPLYNGQLIATVSFFCPLSGLCADVQLYFGFTKPSNKTTKFYLNGRCGTCLQVGFSFFELKSLATHSYRLSLDKKYLLKYPIVRVINKSSR